MSPQNRAPNPRHPWLTARPIAHRGLHDAAHGIIENTATAATAAIAGGYGIEADLQVSADGEAIVHHDEALGRLTEGEGLLRDLPAAALKLIAYKAAAERMLTLGDLVDLVAGRTALVLELKSRFDGDVPLTVRTATVLGDRGVGRRDVVRPDAGHRAADSVPRILSAALWPNATIGRRIGTCSEGCGSLN